MTRRLLVISHEATRTGAPRVLLELLRHLQSSGDVALAVQLVTGGSLAADLLALDDGIDPADVDGVLVNSALAAASGLEAAPGRPTALYVHEDGDNVARLPAADRDAIVRYDRVLCVSDEILEELVTLGVRRDRVSVLPPLVVAPAPVSDSSLAAARASFGAEQHERVVLGCGEGGWRKGADLFVAVAAHLADATHLRFAWLGHRPRSFGRLLDHDVATFGLDDRIRWLDETDDVGPVLAAADVLVMPSRYDPQPLVAIEAACVGTPTVGFAVGGIADLAGDGGALVAPFPDVTGLAALVDRVLTDPCTAQRLVAGAVDRWRRRQALEVVGPQLMELIDGLLGAGRR